MWVHESISELMGTALAERDAALREEQAVYGLDALDEVALHPILAGAFAASGMGVLREQPYPTQWKRKRREGEDLPLPRDRARCDLVLTPRAGQTLRDSLTLEKAASARRRAAAGTLFESAAREGDVGETPNPGTLAPDDAYWLEVKVVAQFSVEGGVPGPNSAYGSQLTRFAAADVGKLSADRTIVHGGLGLVLFTADAETARHDTDMLMDRLIGRGLRVSSPLRSQRAILDRIGNTLCSVVLIPLRPAPPLDD